MTFVRQASSSLARTAATLPDREFSSGGGDPPLVTIGMVLPLLWSGRATRCGVRPRPSRDTERRSTG
jgi:hypothetical protein